MYGPSLIAGKTDDGQTISLLAPKKEILPQLVEWLNDAEVMVNLNPEWQPTTSAAEAARLVRFQQNPEEIHWHIYLENEPVGAVWINELTETSGSLGIFLGNKKIWGQGIGKLVMQAVCRYAFTELNLISLHMAFTKTNIASKKIAEHLNFTLVSGTANFTQNKEYPGWNATLTKQDWQKSVDYLAPTIATYNQKVTDYIQATANLALTEEIEKFSQLLPANARILDAGCAWGRDSLIFAKKGFQVTGIDLADGFLTEARKYAPEATFLKMDLRKLNFPANSFEGIWACASLLHLNKEDIQQALQDFFHMLTPGGVLFIDVKEDLKSKAVAEKHTIDGERHFTYLQQEELNAMLTAAGFTIIESYKWSEREKYGPTRRDMWWALTFAQKSG